MGGLGCVVQSQWFFFTFISVYCKIVPITWGGIKYNVLFTAQILKNWTSSRCAAQFQSHGKVFATTTMVLQADFSHFVTDALLLLYFLKALRTTLEKLNFWRLTCEYDGKYLLLELFLFLQGTFWGSILFDAELITTLWICYDYILKKK